MATIESRIPKAQLASFTDTYRNTRPVLNHWFCALHVTFHCTFSLKLLTYNLQSSRRTPQWCFGLGVLARNTGGKSQGIINGDCPRVIHVVQREPLLQLLGGLFLSGFWVKGSGFRVQGLGRQHFAHHLASVGMTTIQKHTKCGGGREGEPPKEVQR